MDGLTSVFSVNILRVYGMLGESEKWTPRPIRWREENGITMVDNLWTVGQADAGAAIEVGAIIEANGDTVVTCLAIWR